MDSALDAPQALASIHPSAHQSAEWYETQQGTTLPTFVFSPMNPRAYCYEQVRPSRDFAAQRRFLQQHYMILDNDRVITELLEEEPALYTLLIEAVKPLQDAFGEKRIVQVRTQFSDDETLLKVAVQLPGDFGDDPERALRSFDRPWWLHNCHRSNGALVFDYEIQDAV